MSKLDLSIIIKFVDKATQPIRQFQKIYKIQINL